MAWIGIECGVEAHDLEKWARYVENAGGGSGSAEGVADLLRRCAKLVSGVGITGVSETERLREIEMRAVDAIERKRADASNAATAIVGRVMGDGVEYAKVMCAAGMRGYVDGNAAGKKNGGKANRLRSARSVNRGGRVVRDFKSGGGGAVVATAERVCGDGTEEGRKLLARGGCAGVVNTLKLDSFYGRSWEGWAGTELRKLGFKMKRVAFALGLDNSTCWRYISGYSRYWKKESIAGRVRPGVTDEDWLRRYEDAKLLALGGGGRGSRSGGGGGGVVGVVGGVKAPGARVRVMNGTGAGYGDGGGDDDDVGSDVGGDVGGGGDGESTTENE